MVEQATYLISQMKNNIQDTELISNILSNLESIVYEKFDGDFSSSTRKFYHYDWTDFDYLLLTSLQNQSFDTFKMLLSNEYYIMMISYYNFPSDVLISCINFITENYDNDYDNSINLLDNFIKQIEENSKDKFEEIQDFKEKVYLILYKNFKLNIFPQFVNSFSTQEKDKIISSYLNNLNKLFEHNHTIEFLFQNLSGIKKLSEWLISNLKITEDNFETFLKVCKILMKNNDQENLFSLVKYNFFYLKHIQNEVFDFLNGTRKYNWFYKENNDYIQYKCYQYFVRNNIKLYHYNTDEVKQLFWIEPYFLSSKLQYFFEGCVDCKYIYHLAYDIFIGQNETLKNELKPKVLSMLKVFGPYLNEDGTIINNFCQTNTYESPKFINPLFKKLDIMTKIKLYPKYQPKKVKELIKLIMFSATNNMNYELTKILLDKRIKDLEKNKLMKLLDDVYKVYSNDKKYLAQFLFENYLEFINDTLLNTIVYFCFNSKSYEIFNQIQNRLWKETKIKLCKKVSKKAIKQLKWEKYVFVDKEEKEEEEEFCLSNLF